MVKISQLHTKRSAYALKGSVEHQLMRILGHALIDKANINEHCIHSFLTGRPFFSSLDSLQLPKFLHQIMPLDGLVGSVDFNCC